MQRSEGDFKVEIMLRKIKHSRFYDVTHEITAKREIFE